MNIKIDEPDADILIANSNYIIGFGNPSGSDLDVLHIVRPNLQMDACLHNRDHFLFYKDEKYNVDRLFATPRCLINGLVTGSSTLMYELMLENKFSGELANFNSSNAQHFHTYRLAKAFIGIAQRDARQAKRLTGKERDKKLYWSERYAIIVADMLRKHSPQDDYSDLDLDLMRLKIQRLPKSIGHIATYITSSGLSMPADLYDLRFISRYFYENWRDSL